MAPATGLPLSIAGVNEFGYGTSPAMVDGRTLTWLREDELNRPMQSWSAPVPGRPPLGLRFRDAIVLDETNGFAAVQNLTDEPLTSPANRAKFTELLRTITSRADADGDSLPDRWENAVFGGTGAGPETATPSGIPALLAYAFGSGLRQRTPPPAVRLQLVDGAAPGAIHLALQFPRRLGTEGTAIEYRISQSPDGAAWTTDPDAWTLTSIRDPYDGTGCEIVEFTSVDPVPTTPGSGSASAGLARIEVVVDTGAEPGPQP